MAATAAMALGPPPARSAMPGIVSLSWAVSEILFALDVVPMGAAETAAYDQVVGLPPTPAGTVDVGLQGAPNLEYLAQLAPDIIIIQSWQADQRAALERCGRVEQVDMYTAQADIYENACNATRQIGAFADVGDRAAALISRTQERFVALKSLMQPKSIPPVYVAQMIDDNNLTVFSRGSLFDAALERLGLRNAWTGEPTLLWGGSVIGVEQLAEMPEAVIALVAAPGLAPDECFTHSPIWQALPPVRMGRFVRLPSFWGFGALPTALRFGEALAAALVSSFPDG